MAGQLRIYEPPVACFRYFEQGHKSRECRGPVRSTLCRKCFKKGLIAKEFSKQGPYNG